jgi:hypothetical protein
LKEGDKAMSEPFDTSAESATAEEERRTPAVCRMLRTKHSFGTFVGNLYSWQAGASTTAVYWCLNTMETAGPDDGYAHPHNCRAGRTCFESDIE